MGCFECSPAAPRATRRLPEVGAARPAISRSAVDLPQPDGPTSDTNSPLAMARSSGPSAMTPLSNVLVTPERSTARPLISGRTLDGTSDKPKYSPLSFLDAG